MTEASNAQSLAALSVAVIVFKTSTATFRLLTDRVTIRSEPSASFQIVPWPEKDSQGETITSVTFGANTLLPWSLDFREETCGIRIGFLAFGGICLLAVLAHVRN